VGCNRGVVKPPAPALAARSGGRVLGLLGGWWRRSGGFAIVTLMRWTYGAERVLDTVGVRGSGQNPFTTSERCIHLRRRDEAKQGHQLSHSANPASPAGNYTIDSPTVSIGQQTVGAPAARSKAMVKARPALPPLGAPEHHGAAFVHRDSKSVPCRVQSIWAIREI